jgi:formylglycine-generating enzyme required for sulfatase activity
VGFFYSSGHGVRVGARNYLLPEYAARAGSISARPWGEDPNQACAYANVADITAHEGSFWETKHGCRDGYWFAAPVGSYKPNRFGLHDIMGNVWEWVQDCYHESYGGAPADASPWEGGKCEACVLRGGSWFSKPQDVRSAIRNRFAPPNRVSSDGFRVARTLP